jgi:DNA-directed RNA polymerase specialized sigma subunit
MILLFTHEQAAQVHEMLNRQSRILRCACHLNQKEVVKLMVISPTNIFQIHKQVNDEGLEMTLNKVNVCLSRFIPEITS